MTGSERPPKRLICQSEKKLVLPNRGDRETLRI
jgi:hypothetical protein